MARALQKLPSFEGAAAGQTATVRIPLGYTYERLMIRMSVGSPAADVGEADWGANLGGIRLLVDGDAKIDIDAGDLVSINKYYGHAHDAGVLPLFLVRPWARTVQGEDLTGYGTATGIDSLTLEVDIKSGITLGAISAYAIVSDPRPFGPHLRIQKFVENVGVAGEVEIAGLPRGAYAGVAAHIKSGAITRTQVFANDRKIHDADKAIREQVQRMAGRAPQSGWTGVDFLAPTNRVGDGLGMDLLDFRIKADFTTTGSVPIYWESIQDRGALAI